MTKLSDVQLVVLSAACQRPDRNVLPLPERIKGGAAQKVVASLLGKQLIEEAAAGPGEPVWREAEDLRGGAAEPKGWSNRERTTALVRRQIKSNVERC